MKNTTFITTEKLPVSLVTIKEGKQVFKLYAYGFAGVDLHNTIADMVNRGRVYTGAELAVKPTKKFWPTNGKSEATKVKIAAAMRARWAARKSGDSVVKAPAHEAVAA